MIRFNCRCGKAYQVDDQYAGRKTRCSCGRDIVVPGQSMPTVQTDVTVDHTPGQTPPISGSANDATIEHTPAGDTPQKPFADDVTIEHTPQLPESGTAPTIDHTSEPPHTSRDSSSQQSRETAKPASTVGNQKGVSSPGTQYGCHKILRTHAKGGMGKISIAVDRNLKREVALKELFFEAKGSTIRQRFLEEAEITARLEHPGIVPVHAFGVDAKGSPYYTMKLVRGKTFQEAIREYHTMPDDAESKTPTFRDLIRRFAAVCQTMSFAHDKGIIHRDLKPANIMLGEHGETLVMDWGLAKPYSESDDGTLGDLAAEKLNERPEITQQGKIVGTPAYMSPEQASGDGLLVGPQSDIYSLGAILYHILAGTPPYTGKSSAEIVQKVLNETPLSPLQVRTGVPKGLDAICMKAIAREQSRRYFSATMLYRDLTNWLDDEPITARKDTRWERIWRWTRKNRDLATTLFLSIITFTIILGVCGMMLERAKAKTVAATMLADEMQKRAEEALKLAATKEVELAAKEKELAGVREVLSKSQDSSEEEKLALRGKIDGLVEETNGLREEINRLRILATELSGKENQEGDLDTLEKFSLPVLFDINQMSRNGQVKINAFDTSSGSIDNLFDISDPTRGMFAVSDSINPVSVMLVFPHEQKISGLRFRYTNEKYGIFRVEIADTIEDIETQTGSYKLLVPDTLLDKETDYEENIVAFPKAVKLRVIRLAVQRTAGNDQVHLHALRFWGFPNLAEVPDPLALTEDEYHQLREKYPELELSENMSDYNVIVLRELTDAELRNAISMAENTVKDDLIVARTTANDNAIILNGTEISININAEQRGAVILASLGNEKLTLDADKKSRIFYIENGRFIIAGQNIINGTSRERGGGMLNHGVLHITQSSFVDNFGHHGGALYSTEQSNLFIKYSTFLHNTANEHGGAVEGHGFVQLSGNTFCNNHAINHCGGALNVYAKALIENSVFYANTAGTQGGAIVVFNNVVPEEEVIIHNSTVAGNFASQVGGGIVNFKTTFQLNNSLLFNNTVRHPNQWIDLYNPADVDVDNNNLIDIAPGFLVPPQFDAEGNLTNLNQIDLRLRSDSPAIDAGASYEGMSKNDAAGNPRVFGRSVDIGAYEYQGPNGPKGTPFVP